MTFNTVSKRITGQILLVGPFCAPGFCKAVSNPWPTLIYLCFAKMLLRDSAMSSCNSGEAYFRSSGLQSVWMPLATSYLAVDVSKGLWLPMNGSNFDFSGHWNVLWSGLLWCCKLC